MGPADGKWLLIKILWTTVYSYLVNRKIHGQEICFLGVTPSAPWGKQERFVTTKPSPSKKLRKRALIYGLYMVGREIDTHKKEKQAVVADREKQIAA